MKSKIDPGKLLSMWENCWEKLSPKWAENFLKDPRIEKITAFPALSILDAIQKNKKLDEILLYLEESSKQVKIKANLAEKVVVKPVIRKKKDLGTPAEVDAIYEWLRRMDVAKFNPESTFPRLILKSDPDTCESKVKYNSEIDSILALIQLENRKKELIKQLPYKCGICGKFHNTHLISREILEKLLRKYGRNYKNI
jgi:hypothetical protein